MKPHPWTSWTCLFALTKLCRSRNSDWFLKCCWNLSISLTSLSQSLPCQHQLSLCPVPKQAGRQRCHSSSAPKCSTKAHFLNISVLMKYKETDLTRSFLLLQAHPGRDSELCWSQPLTASTKTKVTLLGKWNGDSLQLLNLENTVESRPVYFKVLSATPTLYLCSSFTRVRKKTVHSHMLLITSQLQGLLFRTAPGNRKSWLASKTYLPSLNQLRK